GSDQAPPDDVEHRGVARARLLPDPRHRPVLPGRPDRCRRGRDRPGEEGVRQLPGAPAVPRVRHHHEPGVRGLGRPQRGGAAGRATRVAGPPTGGAKGDRRLV
ncbi:MAG: hypothetical protein AVDCRST_MAG76-1508, partial [uncultured Acidimicrobiales bacterium]